MKIAYSKAELVVIKVLLKTAKIGRDHYLPWCYQLIEQIDEPPQWLLDMSYARNMSEAQTILHFHIYREGTVGEIPHEADLEIAVLYLEYQAGKISWADFLLTIGQLSDRFEGRIECSWFFALLNEFEAVSGSRQTRIGHRQEQSIEKLYQNEIKQAKECRAYFEQFYDKTVR
jgi:hypothetical protein